MSDNLFDDYNYENQIRSLEDLEETIAFQKEEIRKLREDLEKNGDDYSAENYEMTENAIYAIETVMKKYQEELKKGRFEEAQEHNFKIEKTMSGSFIVRSDSERFGKDAIVYENPDRNKCIDYIEERKPAKKPVYYVIDNLKDFMDGKSQNIFRGTLEECLEKYSSYVLKYDDTYKNHVTSTLGVTTGDIVKIDTDLIRCIDGVSYIATDIVRNHEHNSNKYVLNDLNAIVDVLDVKQAAIVKENSIEYVPLKELDQKEIFEAYLEKSVQEKAVLKDKLQNGFVNGVALPKTGYNDAPEVTQERLDKVLRIESKTVNFEGCYFSDVVMTGKFINSNFKDCNLYECKLKDAEFINTNFQNAHFLDIDMENVVFDIVNFEEASMHSMFLKNCTFKDTDFSYTSWRNVSTSKNTVSFENCDFLLADMNKVYIRGSEIAGEIKNVNTIYITMGGATDGEVKKHRQDIIDTLQPDQKITKKLEENKKKDRGSSKVQTTKPRKAKRH